MTFIYLSHHLLSHSVILEWLQARTDTHFKGQTPYSYNECCAMVDVWYICILVYFACVSVIVSKAHIFHFSLH